MFCKFFLKAFSKYIVLALIVKGENKRLLYIYLVDYSFHLLIRLCKNLKTKNLINLRGIGKGPETYVCMQIPHTDRRSLTT